MHALAITGPGRRRLYLAGLSLAALALHGALLGGIVWVWPHSPAAPPTNAVVWMRLIDGAAPAAAPIPASDDPGAIAAAAAIADVVAPPPRQAPRRPPARPALRRPPASAVPLGAAAARDAAAAGPAGAAQALPLALAVEAAMPAASVGGALEQGEAIPHYRTRLPPPTTLRYELRHGALHGTGELAWQPQGDHYELRLDGRVGALKALTQISTGGFDAAGVAPERYTDQRLRRAATAANFQRSAGKITFSGPSTEYPLRAGAQDRLSWMVQLGAILAAEPHRAESGAEIAMFVVGARGEAGVWLFRCVGREAVQTGIGAIDAIKFVREPRDLYDTTVQVWLDPLQHGLPVRATQRSGPDGAGFELRLEEVLVPR
jgi:hypothetical protein